MRIRTIKPEIFTHAELYDLEQELGCPVRFAWAGLWCVCDREGRFQWEPRRLGALILPFDCAAGLDFSRVLDAWLTRGFIAKYRAGDAWFGCIPSWRRHQFINNRESPSVLPDISRADEVTDACPTRAPRVPHATEGDRERKGKGKEGNGSVFDRSSSSAEPTMVGSIYSAYPRKVGKSDALKAITRTIKAGAITADALLAKVQAYAAAVATWPEAERKYVPHPATWINRGSFDDDPATWQRGKPVANGGFAGEPASVRAKGWGTELPLDGGNDGRTA